jgi:hypothetical protein
MAASTPTTRVAHPRVAHPCRATLVALVFTSIATAAETSSKPGPHYPQILAGERAKLTGQYAIRPHAGLGDETPLSREVYQRLLRYVRLTNPRFKDWPGAKGCRYHKEDGHGEMAVRQNATVALGYGALLKGDYDPNVAGVPRERIERDLVSLLRYIAITHKANFLPTGDGHPWGDQWQSAFWAAIAGRAAWLAWDRLDDDTKVMVAGMVAHEADRFNNRPPDSGYRGDTKAEENAWNSEVIALAACMFPQHPNAKLWHERAIVYMINSFTREADRTLEKIVDGKPARERIATVTLYPDFTLENHNRVHPDYLACTSLLLWNASLYRAAGLPIPQSTFFNVPETFAVIKRLTATNGSFFYVNGQDWWVHRHDDAMMVGSHLGVLTGDPDAAHLERASLEFYGRMHARFTNGSAWEPREYNYRNAEEEMIACYADLYIFHRLFGDGPKPATREEFLSRQSGTQVYETGGFVIHRTADKFASFCWTNGAMGLVYVSDDTWFTSPFERGMVGRILCDGLKDTTPSVTEHQVQVEENGFSLGARIDRCEGKVEQAVAVFSLPTGPVLYLERLVARDAITIKEITTSSFGLLNEDAPGISPNRRTAHYAGGKEEIIGRSDAPARLLRWKSGWANIDDRLGIICTGGAMAYRDNNTYHRSRLEEELVPNYRCETIRVAKDRPFGLCAVAYIPNQPAEATAKLQLELAGAADVIVAANLDGTVVVANLGRQPAEGQVFERPVSLGPLETAVFEK